MINWRSVLLFVLVGNLWWCARAQEDLGQFMFSEYYTDHSYALPMDSLRKYGMRELSIAVYFSGSQNLETTYTYALDRQWRLKKFTEYRHEDSTHTTKRFYYKDKYRLKRFTHRESDPRSKVKVTYAYRYEQAENGEEWWIRERREGEWPAERDSIRCAFDHEHRLTSLVEYWSNEPQRSTYKYFQSGDTAVVEATRWHQRSYGLYGNFYDQVVQYRQVRNAHDRPLFKENRYISYHTDCGVGLLLSESFNYDAQGRLSTHVVDQMGMGYRLLYRYIGANTWIIERDRALTHEATVEPEVEWVAKEVIDSRGRSLQRLDPLDRPMVIYRWRH